MVTCTVSGIFLTFSEFRFKMWSNTNPTAASFEVLVDWEPIKALHRSQFGSNGPSNTHLSSWKMEKKHGKTALPLGF